MDTNKRTDGRTARANQFHGPDKERWEKRITTIGTTTEERREGKTKQGRKIERKEGRKIKRKEGKKIVRKEGRK